MWLPLVRLLLGTWPATQAFALTGMEPVTFWFEGLHSIHWATQARTYLRIFLSFTNLLVFKSRNRCFAEHPSGLSEVFSWPCCSCGFSWRAAQSYVTFFLTACQWAHDLHTTWVQMTTLVRGSFTVVTVFLCNTSFFKRKPLSWA